MDFTKLLEITLGAILINNFIFSQFLGICPFMGVSKKMDTAAGMGMAVIFVMGLASAICWVINEFILMPLELGYLQTLAYILVIAALVQFVEMFLKKGMPSLYSALGIYLPLITTNCAVLGAVLINTQNHYNFIESLVYGAVRQHPREAALHRVSQVLRGLPHRPGHRCSAGSGFHGLLRHEDLVKEAH